MNAAMRPGQALGPARRTSFDPEAALSLMKR